MTARDMPILNHESSWYSASQLAGLPGMPTTRAGVIDRSNRESWPKRPRQGRGGGYEYPLSALPAETIAALSKTSTVQLTLPTIESARHYTDAQAETLAAVYEAKPQSEKDKAHHCLAAVQEWKQLELLDVPYKARVAVMEDKYAVSAPTISRYLTKVDGAPEHLWLYLLTPGYVGRTKKADMDAEAWEYLKADYLRREQPTATACILRLQRIAAQRGWKIPSKKTLERRLDAIPEAVKVLARQGEKALQAMYPAQKRDKSALSALEIINGDGYKHNLWVQFPDGEICRAKTWVWQDVYSNAITTWRIDKTEHTDVIRLSFGDLCERFGIPDKHVLLDNTLAAANKTMSGGTKTRFRFKVREDEPLGVFPLLGLQVMWATPKHGQSKPVERCFGVGGLGEIVDKAPEFAGSWTGNSVANKPDADEYDGKSRPVPLAELERVMAREIDAWNRREGRRSAIAKGRSYWQVFEESYNTKAIRKPTESQRRLWLLATEPVKANRVDGSITLDAGRIVGEALANRYWAPELNEHRGQQVVARFDPARLHEGVHVYTLDGRYLCYAECHAAEGFNDRDAAREHQRNRRGYMKAQKQLLEAELRMDALEAAKYMPGSTEAPAGIPAPKGSGVVKGEFRDPLARPVPRPTLTAEQQADIERLAANFEAGIQARETVLVERLNSDVERYDYWQRLHERAQAGETLDSREDAFYRAFGDSAYCRMAREAEKEFEATLRQRA
jgi:hypothetical protein